MEFLPYFFLFHDVFEYQPIYFKSICHDNSNKDKDFEVDMAMLQINAMYNMINF